MAEAITDMAAGDYLGQPVANAGARIDLHLLRFGAREDWFLQALGSARDQECNLHVFEGSARGPGHVRAVALGLGSAPYVGWLDDDDALAPDACRIAADALDEQPQISAIYSDVMRIAEDGSSIGVPQRGPWSPYRQLMRPGDQLHFMVWRRAIIAPHLALCAEHPWLEWAALAAISAKVAPLAHIPQTLYRWRRKAQGGCAERITPLDRERLNALAAPILMPLHRARITA